MTSNHRIVKIVGTLFIVQMITAVLSYSVILDPILYSINFPDELALNSVKVTIAMFLDLTCGASVLAIAVLLYPILKHYNERIALWYLGTRLSELISFMISGFLLLTLLRIGKDMTSMAEDISVVADQVTRFLRSARGHVQNIALVVYCLGAWSFYGLLYHYKLLPRFISAWGFLGVTLLFVEIVANIFSTSLGGMMIMMPLGLNELFLGVWLISKGLNIPR